MKIDFSIKVMREGLYSDDGPIKYYHIICGIEGSSEEHFDIARVLRLFWDRLSTGKKSYGRKEPWQSVETDFESGKLISHGGFRLSTTDEPGDLILANRAYDSGGYVSVTPFGLAPDVKRTE